MSSSRRIKTQTVLAIGRHGRHAVLGVPRVRQIKMRRSMGGRPSLTKPIDQPIARSLTDSLIASEMRNRIPNIRTAPKSRFFEFTHLVAMDRAWDCGAMWNHGGNNGRIVASDADLTDETTDRS